MPQATPPATSSPEPSPQEAVAAILRTADVVRRRLEKVMHAHGVTGQQYNVLRILRGALPDPLPTLEIGERMIEQTPGVTRLLDRLERKKLVARERSTEDRRLVLCSIAPAGLRLLQEMEDDVDAADGAAVETLRPEEVAELVRLLGAVRAVGA